MVDASTPLLFSWWWLRTWLGKARGTPADRQDRSRSMRASTTHATCLYVVLGVSPDADADAIRRAYRARALEWHPDKNPERLEEAQERFREARQAYEVLSNPAERSWYDRRRDVVRHGGDGGDDDAFADQGPIDLARYVDEGCFYGFGNDGRGFFATYGRAFDEVEAMEDAAAEAQELWERVPMPPFGGPDDEWDVVSQFYARWEAFATCRNFYWADKHRFASADSRKVRRLMEEENRKERKRAKREYLDDVKRLVTFVKRRDPRVVAHQALAKQQQEERRAALEQKRKEEQQERIRRAKEYVEPEWVRNQSHVVLEDDVESSEEEGEERWEDDCTEKTAVDVQGQSGSTETAGEPLAPESLYCIACKKKFKSVKQRVNHVQSKKHLDNVAKLRESLLEEEGLEEEDLCMYDDLNATSFQNSGHQSEQPGRPSKKKKKKKAAAQHRNVAQAAPGIDPAVDEGRDRSTTGTHRTLEEELEQLNVDEHNDVAYQETRNNHVDLADEVGQMHLDAEGPELSMRESSTHKEVKKEKESKKARKKKQAKAASETNNACKICGLTFETRNRLFQHIKETGHAAYK
mmetsp:Transcript_8509/g.53172  ORF Transcript_8509/g.53172 Transcript_8509/m.53172 type:complete len:579 (-) Transcript_8509:1732-3468(-)